MTQSLGETGNWHDSLWPQPVVSSPPHMGSGDSYGSQVSQAGRPVEAPGKASLPSYIGQGSWQGP